MAFSALGRLNCLPYVILLCNLCNPVQRAGLEDKKLVLPVKMIGCYVSPIIFGETLNNLENSSVFSFNLYQLGVPQISSAPDLLSLNQVHHY